MTYISLGQFNIPVAWLAFILAIFYSDFRSRKAGVATNKLLEQLVITYILVWKFSYILFSLPDFIKAPLSLVYFDGGRSEEHTSELQSRENLVCRLLLEKKNNI